MKFRFKKIHWITIGLFWTGLAFSNPFSPMLQIPSADFDFGEGQEGSIVSHDYLIKNTGSGIMEIKEVRPG